METQIKNQFSAKDLLKSLPDSFTKLSEEEQELSLAIYHGLEKGNPLKIEDLVSATTLDKFTVKAIIKKWPAIFYDSNQHIIGYWGLAIQEMGHKIELNDKTLYGWCAWDTLFIPQLIEKDAVIRSTDHLTKEEVVIEIDRNGNLLAGDDDIYISMLTVDEKSIQEDVVTTFCHFVHFFKSKSSGVDWISKHDGTFLITLNEAIELSKIKNSLQYRNFLN